MKKSFLSAIVGFFALITTSVYGQFVFPVVGGNVMLNDPTNNVVLGPLPTTPTNLYVNNNTTGVTTLSLDNQYAPVGVPANYVSRKTGLNFNLGGTNLFNIYTSTAQGSCTNGFLNIVPSSATGAGIFLSGTTIAFRNNDACATSIGSGKYIFDGMIGSAVGINVGYNGQTTPPLGYTFSNSGMSYFKDKVLIGTTSTTLPTTAYKLYVGGSIVCEELVVKLQANWGDYVFAPSYKLMPLSQVKAYIDANSHLPDVPAACEIEENGIATSEMLTIQMKKIEELTLYLIQMEERIKQLEAQNKALQNVNGQ